MNNSLQCTICERIFSTKSNLNQHLKKKYPCEKKITIYKCDNCHKMFSSNFWLNHHKNNRKIACTPLHITLAKENENLKKNYERLIYINDKNTKIHKKTKNIINSNIDDREFGCVYFIQPEYNLKSNTYKFGYSSNLNFKRVSSYGANSKLYFYKACKNANEVERCVLEELSLHYEKLKNEYFIIDDVDGAIDIIIDKIKNM